MVVDAVVVKEVVVLGVEVVVTVVVVVCVVVVVRVVVVVSVVVVVKVEVGVLVVTQSIVPFRHLPSSVTVMQTTKVPSAIVRQYPEPSSHTASQIALSVGVVV